MDMTVIYGKIQKSKCVCAVHLNYEWNVYL